MDKKKVGLCILSGLILIGLFKEAPSLLFITIIFISYFIYRKKKKQLTVIKPNEHWGTTQTQYQNQSKEFNESREQTAASSQTITREVPKEIMECPICHQKNRVIIGKINPICGRCRNPLNGQSSNENRNKAAFDIFNNSNPKIIEKNMESGFFDESSFAIRYTSDGLLDYRDVQDKINEIVIERNHNKNHQGAKKSLITLTNEMGRFFKHCYERDLVDQNQYWFLYFAVLSEALFNLAVCCYVLDEGDSMINFGTISAYTNMDFGEQREKRFDQLGEIVLYGYSLDGAGVYQHPKDFLRENEPQSLQEKMDYFYKLLK